MNKRKRVSLSIRLQPYSGTLLSEVVDWLNSQEKDEKNDLVASALIMAYLPLARADQNVSLAEIERCCWETQNMLDKHGSNLRQSLRVRQPQWHSSLAPTTISTPIPIVKHQTNDETFKLNEKDEEDFVPTSLLEGEEDHDDDLFPDD